MKDWHWFVYILECDDGLYYTGMTYDLDKRLEQHQTGKGVHLLPNTASKDFAIPKNIKILKKPEIEKDS